MLVDLTEKTGGQAVGMTGFGLEVWKLAASRGVTTQRELSRRILKSTGEQVSFDAVRNYLYGRSTVPPGFPRQVASALHLDESERTSLAMAYAFGQREVERKAS